VRRSGMLGLVSRLQWALAFVRSFVHKQVLEQSRSGERMPVRVVRKNGRLRLDGVSVNYSFGTLHAIFAEALRRVGIRARAPRSVLLLGLGAGSVVALLRRTHAIEAPIVAVECDAEVLRLAEQYFGLARWRALEVVMKDALEFVRDDPRTFDLVVVDLFVDARVPRPCREAPFLRALRQRLANGGLLLFNTIPNPDDGAGEAAFADNLRAVFPRCTAMPIRSNLVFAADADAAAPAPPGNRALH